MWAERGKASPAVVSQTGLRLTCRGREGTAAVTRRGAVVLAALALAACTNGSANSATPSATATSPRTATIPAPSSPSPTATTDPATAAKAAYLRYRQAIDRAYGNPGQAAKKELDRFATGGRLRVLNTQLQALIKDQVRQEGTVVVKKVAVTSYSPATGAQTAQAFLTACLDYSRRTYVDKDGAPVFPSQKGARLAKATINMIQLKGEWLVVDERNPPVESC